MYRHVVGRLVRSARRLPMVGLASLLLFAAACTSEDEPELLAGRIHRADGSASPGPSVWKAVFSDMPGALFSVWGSSERDVWIVGSDSRDGHGPEVLHYDGTSWIRKAVVSSGDLWWVHGAGNGPVFMGGTDGMILRFDAGRFTRVAAPHTSGTVFGIWGIDSVNVWAVGGDVLYGTGAFVWRLVGDRFEDAGPLPIPPEDVIAYFKVWGTSASDVWIVGTPGLSLHFDGARFERVAPGVSDPLFTVHARPTGDLYAAVGGADLGVLIERGADASWSTAAVPAGTRTLFGVWLTPGGGYAVGDDATVLSRSGGVWRREPTGLAEGKGFHSVWVDSSSGVWAAGGDILTPPFGSGVLVHKGKDVSGAYSVEIATIADASIDHAGPGSDAGLDASRNDGGDARSGDAAKSGDGAPDAPHDARVVRDARVDGAVTCGSATCTLPLQICCADETTGVPAGCTSAGTACPTGQAPVHCDEPSDCPKGFECCLNRLAQVGPLQNIECEPTCFGPAVCQTSADCDGRTCSTFPIMRSYMICPKR